MPDPTNDLVRIDETGTAHAVSRSASQKMRARRGTFRLMPAPAHIVFMRYVGDDGRRDDEDGAIVKLSGEIVAHGSLCDIVALISQASWRGELVVLDGLTSRSIFFEQGNVVGAQSTAAGERLGEILYQFGALTEQEVERCMALEGRRIGDAAVELGLLTREKLFQLMSKQAEEIVYKTLVVGDGMFYFLDRFDDSRLSIRTNLRTNALLMEGVRRMDEVNYFRERIPSDDHVPVRLVGKRDPDEEFRLLWLAIDGEASVAELGRRCEISLFDATRIVFQLCQSGHVQIRPPRSNDPHALCETFNEALREIFRATDQHGGSASLRATLASFSSGAGVYDALFRGAGPAPDGSIVADRVVANIASLAGDDPLATLAQWLQEYARFALFAASSLLPKDREQLVSRRVSDLITLLGDSNQRAADEEPPRSGVTLFNLET